MSSSDALRLAHRDARHWSVLGTIKEVGDRSETKPARAENHATSNISSPGIGPRLARWTNSERLGADSKLRGASHGSAKCVEATQEWPRWAWVRATFIVALILATTIFRS
jgi:hypothetical protein